MLKALVAYCESMFTFAIQFERSEIRFMRIGSSNAFQCFKNPCRQSPLNQQYSHRLPCKPCHATKMSHLGPRQCVQLALRSELSPKDCVLYVWCCVFGGAFDSTGFLFTLCPGHGTVTILVSLTQTLYCWLPMGRVVCGGMVAPLGYGGYLHLYACVRWYVGLPFA